MRVSCCLRPVVLAGLLTALAGCRQSGPEALLEGDRLLREGKAGDAVRVLERAAALLPADARAWNHLGMAYQATGNRREAEKSYRRALQFNRNFFEVHYNLGLLSLELGEYRAAEAALRTYLNARPEHSRNGAAWRALALAQHHQQQVAAAENSLAVALKLDPRDAEAWNTLGLVRLQQRRHQDAYTTFVHAARLDPVYAVPRRNAAITAQQHLGDPRAALQWYRDYLGFKPSDEEAVAARVAELSARLGEVAAVRPATPATNPPAIAGPSTNPPASRNAAAPATNPPPRVAAAATNPPPATPGRTPTNPPPAGIARPSGPVRPPATNPPPAVASRPQPAPTVATAAAPATPVPPPPGDRPRRAVPVVIEPVPEPEPARPAEVVAVEPDFVPKPADPVPPQEASARPDPDPGTPPPPIAEPAAPAPTEVVSDPSPSANDGAETPAAEPGTPGEDPSFWRKISPTTWGRPIARWGNPANWFRRDDREGREPDAGKAPTPLDAPAVATPEPETVVAQASPATVTVPEAAPVRVPEAAVPPPAPPRYVRRGAAVPRPGDRAAAEAAFREAYGAQQRGEPASAVAAYERSVAADPTYFEAQHNLMLAALASGNLTAALAAGERAVQLRPDSVSARYNFAVALQKGRFSADAAEELEKVIEAQPNNVGARIAAGNLYALELGDDARARAHYERALELGPTHPQAPTVRRWLGRNPAR